MVHVDVSEDGCGFDIQYNIEYRWRLTIDYHCFLFDLRPLSLGPSTLHRKTSADPLAKLVQLMRSFCHFGVIRG